jgi:hypothetical protein
MLQSTFNSLSYLNRSKNFIVRLAKLILPKLPKQLIIEAALISDYLESTN